MTSTITELHCSSLPKDFDPALWLDPLTFQGLIGAAIAKGNYSKLFRPCGFAKSISELKHDGLI